MSDLRSHPVSASPPGPGEPDPPIASHRFHVQARFATLALNITAALTAPWTILFGPSGSGKSSVLRALCGLLPDARTTLHTSVHRTAHRALHPPGENLELSSLPIHRRGLAYAPQQPSLFPHLTVRENVLFASQVAAGTSTPSMPGAETLDPAALVDQARDLFHLDALWFRRPAELSGGEQQRVNLARAWAVPHAHLLLLDEPFTGFDRPLRNRILPDLQAALALRGLPVLSVTHDVEEAFLLHADILRLQAGRLVAHGPAHTVLAPERRQLLSTLKPSQT